MRKFVDLRTFRDLADSNDVAVRAGLGDIIEFDEATRTVRFVFSDSTVDRYGDTVDAKGWDLKNFQANPVALFGHDATQAENVIGKAANVAIVDGKLVGDIVFMPKEINPAADMVFQMVKGGFLNAVSVGFLPKEWQRATDKSRPGGIDFKKQELLEISVVPIPANPNALELAYKSLSEKSWHRRDLAARKADGEVVTKGMYHVACLADVLGQLGYLLECVTYEAAYEGDGSTVPAELRAAIDTVAAVFVKMAAEEVAELTAGEDDGSGDTATPVLAAAPAADAAAPAPATRAGKKVSAAHKQTLSDAADMISEGVKKVQSVATADEPADDPADQAETSAAPAAETKDIDESERERLRARARLWRHKRK